MQKIGILLALTAVCGGEIMLPATRGCGYELPAVPDSIIGLNSRAVYAVNHFWDNAREEALTEPQVIETFFYALEKVPGDVRQKAVADLIDRCIGNLDRLSLIAWFIDFYIGSPESTFRDDRLYIEAQRHLLDSPIPDEYKIAPRWRVELLTKNEIGSLAPDFSFTDKDGSIRKLYDEPMPCVLIFASSDCGQCRHEQTQSQDVLRKLRRSGWNIISVYLNGHIPDYAASFTEIEAVADIGNYILENDIYVARRLPSVYLIDRNRKIIAKEIRLSEVSTLITKSN